MTGFVVDASMTLAWHFEDEHTEENSALLARTVSDPIVVPRHWIVEVANGVLMAERRQRTSPDQLPMLLARLSRIDINVDDEGGEAVLDRILPLARAHRLTIYDALYLELAERRGLSLATLDKDLADAALGLGLQILGPLGA